MPQSAKLRFETLIATSRGSALSDSKLQEVEGAFQDALEESQGLSIVTKHLYQELLGFLARSGQSEQIQARLKEMKLGGFPADQVTYGIIINALASSAFASLASSFFRQAEQEGIALTLPLCNAMLKASGSAGDLQAAEVGAVAGWNGGRAPFLCGGNSFPPKKEVLWLESNIQKHGYKIKKHCDNDKTCRMRTICQLGMFVKRNAVTLWQFPFFVSFF